MNGISGASIEVDLNSKGKLDFSSHYSGLGCDPARDAGGLVNAGICRICMAKTTASFLWVWVGPWSTLISVERSMDALFLAKDIPIET